MAEKPRKLQTPRGPQPCHRFFRRFEDDLTIARNEFLNYIESPDLIYRTLRELITSYDHNFKREGDEPREGEEKGWVIYVTDVVGHLRYYKKAYNRIDRVSYKEKAINYLRENGIDAYLENYVVRVRTPIERLREMYKDYQAIGSRIVRENLDRAVAILTSDAVLSDVYFQTIRRKLLYGEKTELPSVAEILYKHDCDHSYIYSMEEIKDRFEEILIQEGYKISVGQYDFKYIEVSDNL